MKNILAFLIIVSVSTSSFATVCWSIESNTSTQVTVSVESNSNYNPPASFWGTGLVTIKWPESAGMNFITNVASLNGFNNWAVSGPAVLVSGEYFQKILFTTQSNVDLVSGSPVDAFELTLNAAGSSVSMEIVEAPTEITGGDAALQNLNNNQFASGGCNLIALVALPVELTQFDVKKKGEENALITWQTATEVNTSHFDIERSLDNGRTWEKVGIKSAQGFSTAVNNYSFEDKNLKRFIDENQLVYYRLKSVDFDQSHQLSETKNIRIELIDISIAIYPNPTVEGVNVTIHSKDKREELMVEVKDISGRTIFSQALGSSKMINEYLSFGNLASGTYFMTVQSEERVFSTEKLIILEK